MTADMQSREPVLSDDALVSEETLPVINPAENLPPDADGSFSDIPAEQQAEPISAEEIAAHLERLFAQEKTAETIPAGDSGPEPIHWVHMPRKRAAAAEIPAEHVQEAADSPELEDDEIEAPEVSPEEEPQPEELDAADQYQSDSEPVEEELHPEEPAEAECPEPAEQKETREKAGTEKQPKKKKRRKTEKATIRPGTSHIRVDNSKMQASTTESVHQMRLNLQERQRAYLPKYGATPASALKHQKKLAGINQTLKPFRLIVLVLMGLCAAGRQYQWMTLGVMSGLNGTYIAIMMTALAFLLNWQSFYHALRDIRYAQFSYESFLLVASVLAMYEGYHYQNKTSLLPILTMAWCISGMTDLRENQLKSRMLSKISYGKKKRSVRLIKKFWEGNDAIGIAGGTANGFVRHLEEPDLWHQLSSVFYPVYLAALVIISTYISVKTKAVFLTVLVQLMVIGMPLALIQSSTKPYAYLVSAIKKYGAIAGWRGIRNLSGKKHVMMNNDVLFPEGTIHCESFQVYAHLSDSTLISYAASLSLEYDIGYQHAFVELMREINGALMKVEACQPEEGGTRGVIHGDAVLIGSEQYMELNGILLPKVTHPYSIYLAVNGSLAGVFRMRYSRIKDSAKISKAISRDINLTSLITSGNVYLNPKFLSSFFHVSLKRISCPKAATRRKLSEKKAFKNSAVCGFVYQNGLTAYGRVIVGARRLYRVSMIFTVLSIVLQCAFTIRTMSVLLNGGTLISGAAVVALNVILALILELVSRLIFQF